MSKKRSFAPQQITPSRSSIPTSIVARHGFHGARTVASTLGQADTPYAPPILQPMHAQSPQNPAPVVHQTARPGMLSVAPKTATRLPESDIQQQPVSSQVPDLPGHTTITVTKASKRALDASSSSAPTLPPAWQGGTTVEQDSAISTQAANPQPFYELPRSEYVNAPAAADPANANNAKFTVGDGNTQAEPSAGSSTMSPLANPDPAPWSAHNVPVSAPESPVESSASSFKAPSVPASASPHHHADSNVSYGDALGQQKPRNESITARFSSETNRVDKKRKKLHDLSPSDSESSGDDSDSEEEVCTTRRSTRGPAVVKKAKTSVTKVKNKYGFRYLPQLSSKAKLNSKTASGLLSPPETPRSGNPASSKAMSKLLSAPSPNGREKMQGRSKEPLANVSAHTSSVSTGGYVQRQAKLKALKKLQEHKAQDEHYLAELAATDTSESEKDETVRNSLRSLRSSLRRMSMTPELSATTPLVGTITAADDIVFDRDDSSSPVQGRSGRAVKRRGVSCGWDAWTQSRANGDRYVAKMRSLKREGQDGANKDPESGKCNLADGVVVRKGGAERRGLMVELQTVAPRAVDVDPHGANVGKEGSKGESNDVEMSGDCSQLSGTLESAKGVGKEQREPSFGCEVS